MSFSRLHFAALACLALALMPLWVPFVVDRDIRYESISPRVGPFAYHASVLRQPPEHYDVIFVGPSFMWTAIDHAVLQDALSSSLGRPARTTTLGYNWAGDGIRYQLLKDFLNVHEARLVVLSLPLAKDFVSPAAKYLWSVWEDDGFFWSLPLSYKLRLYAEQVHASLKPLYRTLFPVRGCPDRCAEYSDHGTSMRDLGYTDALNGLSLEFKSDAVREPDFSAVSRAEWAILSDYLKKNPNFEVDILAMPEGEALIMERIHDLIKQSGSDYTYLYIPFAANIVAGTPVKIDVARTENPIIITDYNRYFPNVDKIYHPGNPALDHFYDTAHMNSVGNHYFTRMIQDSLVELVGKTDEE